MYQHELPGNYFRIGLKTDWPGFVPGQFGMLEVPHENGVLLRRPFSFARQIKETTEILYKVVGSGTQSLSKVTPGRSLKLLGPLGQGFSIPKKPGNYVGVAGGYGIAPFLELASQLKNTNASLQIFYGARSKDDLLYLGEFLDLGVTLHLATMDGSEGFKGFITDLLSKIPSSQKTDYVWCCGPMGLLQAVQQWSLGQKVPCELSIEETMGCGTGVCLGCVVKDVKGHYQRACVEGPVFDSLGIRI
jgi:dihydroorotate dehydrogenase electron transfer subunit